MAAPRRIGPVLATLLLLAAACQSATPDRATSTTLVVSQSGDPGALNPAVTTSGNTHPVTDQIFNGLVGLDQDLNPVPELAERWAIEDDGRTYRFFLRPNVQWHDGTPFRSADVKFTFEEALLEYHSRTRAALEGSTSTCISRCRHGHCRWPKRWAGCRAKRISSGASPPRSMS